MQLAITNTSSTGLTLPYLEKHINPGATIILEVAQSELCKMVDLQAAVAAGTASYQVTPNPIEEASGLVSAGIPLVPGPAGPQGTSGGNITTFWFHDDDSDVATYKSLFAFPADDPVEDDMFATVTAAGGPQLLEHVHITDPGSPGTTIIPAGPWTFNLYCAVSSAGGNSSIVLHVFKRDLLGGETELFTVSSGQINELPTAPGLHVINSTQPQINLLITDRIGVRPMAQTTAAAARTVHFYHDGVLHNSYMLMPNTGIPDATSTTRGLQSAQGKRIEQQSYESCKYQLKTAAIAGFNPAATSADDWDGAVAGVTWTADTAAHVRLLNQATGTIYTLTTETTCTATGEPVLYGALLSVNGTIGGATQWRQTAVSGPAVFEPLPGAKVLSFSGTLTAGSGAQTLLTYPIAANVRLTLGVNWNVYNSANKLAGYETIVVECVGSNAPTIQSAAFDGATVLDVPAWAPGSVSSSTLVISGNNLLIKIIADIGDSVMAKASLEILSTTDISDAPTGNLAQLITLLNSYGGFLYLASNAVNDGTGKATSIPDSCANANTATFRTNGSFVRPSIGTLTDGITPAIILATATAQPAATLGTANTSHTAIYCGELSPPANFGPVVFGGASTGALSVLFTQRDASTGPGIFDVTDTFICHAPSQVSTLQTMVWRAKASDNTGVILRNGTQVASGTYTTPTALTANNGLFGAPDATTWGVNGKMIATIYCPAAMSDADIATAYGYLKSIFTAASLP